MRKPHTPIMPYTRQMQLTESNLIPNFSLQILLFSRELDIIDYGDGITKQKLQVTLCNDLHNQLKVK